MICRPKNKIMQNKVKKQGLMCRFLSIVVCMLVSLSMSPLSAQGVADVWISKVVEKLQNKGIEIAFHISEEGMHINGKLLMDAQKFAFISEDMKIWNDGTTQWTLQQGGGYNELYISTPNIEDQQSINPYLLLGSYADYFTATDGGEKIRNGKLMHIVTLDAHDDSSEIASADVYIYSDGTLAALEFTTSVGHSYEIEIRSMRNGLTFPKETFTYPEKEFPADEVIDLR